ncbi:MAG: hypothetical protein EAZ55_13805 [Cytophagales bacterium]|nr:MAG: hypothetical protein EAZ55_13805 [Cytophagales bacterium]
MITMKRIILLMLLLVGVYSFCNAQTTEKEQIEATIQLYFEGWLTGDTAKVGKVMHSTCKLKTYNEGVFKETSREDYLSKFKPHAKQDGFGGTILAIDITAHIASAKCVIETPKAVFTDYFNLIKINNFWYIVDKISVKISK